MTYYDDIFVKGLVNNRIAEKTLAQETLELSLADTVNV